MVLLPILGILLCDTIKGFSVKKTSVCMKTQADSMLFTLARVIFCLLIGAFAVLGQIESLAIDATALLICIASGVFTVGLLLSWLLTVEYNAMVTVNTVVSMGSIIPAILCALCFGEAIMPLRAVGFAMIVIASYCLTGYQPPQLRRTGPGKYITLLGAFACDGLLNFCQQLYSRFCTDVPKSVYHFYTYLFAGLILAAVYAGFMLKRREKPDMKSLVKPLPHIVIMAAGLFCANYLQTVLSADFAVPPQVLYPLLRGGVQVTLFLTGMIFFGEKPTRRSLFGTALALAGIVTMNIA